MESGVAVRIYLQAKRRYDMTYICAKYTKRLEARKEQEKIVCTAQEAPAEKRVFLNMTETAFHWQNIRVLEDGRWRGRYRPVFKTASVRTVPSAKNKSTPYTRRLLKTVAIDGHRWYIYHILKRYAGEKVG